MKVDICGDRTADIQYPGTAPCLGMVPKNAILVCPGCSAQDIALKRCHAARIASLIGPTVEARGMLGLTPDRVRRLMADPRALFVGRRPPRGMARVWPPGVCRQSPFANPFVVRKGQFTLAESLALFDAYCSAGFCPLKPEAISNIVSSATPLPPIDDLLRELGILARSDRV